MFVKKIVLVSCRVDINKDYQERRDALDQRWLRLLNTCGYLPIMVPNNMNVAQEMLIQLPVAGVLLTGGNDLCQYGGDASERDLVEEALLLHCINQGLPLLGVCRGMQLLQSHFGGHLKPIIGHVQSEQEIMFRNKPLIVNSYHRFGSTEVGEDFIVEGFAADGVIKAVKHKKLSLYGIMWHPERAESTQAHDIELLQEVLN
jgi:gamma-glutamyl-gamma-aminobutyrate hydrolase PuuD